MATRTLARSVATNGQITVPQSINNSIVTECKSSVFLFADKQKRDKYGWVNLDKSEWMLDELMCRSPNDMRLREPCA